MFHAVSAVDLPHSLICGSCSCSGDLATVDQGAAPTADVAASVWPILLQQNSIRQDLGVASKLLCCNKALGAAVAEHCPGQLMLDLSYDLFGMRDYEVRKPSEKLIAQLECWTAKHARLLRRVDAAWSWGGIAGLVAGLNNAAASTGGATGGLLLQSCSAGAADAARSTPPQASLLELLPVQHLTRLRLEWVRCDDSLDACKAALQRLTGLRQLSISAALERRQLWPGTFQRQLLLTVPARPDAVVAPGTDSRRCVGRHAAPASAAAGAAAWQKCP